MKVDFLIVGAQKSGTTALYKYLRVHPEIEMATQKEVHFFDNENNFTGEIEYLNYHASFSKKSIGFLRGEATPIYMYWNEAPKRIWQYNPKIKLIAVLRNPIERAFSHWNMERDRKYDNFSFSEAIRSEIERCRNALPLQHRVYSYIDRGFYSEQIRRLWHFFPKNQILVLKYEDLKFDLEKTLIKISTFLNVKAFNNPTYIDTHSREYASKMSNDDYSYLYNIFYYEIKMLETMFSWNCRDWLDHGQFQRIRVDCESAANHNLSRLLDEPCGHL